MIVVSDTSPLQYLVQIDCVNALPKLYGEVITAPQVISEMVAPGAPPSVSRFAKRPPEWLIVRSPVELRFVDQLDRGEAAAISLACQERADLVLIDERAGTAVAKSEGLRVIGTLGVLVEAGVEGFIDFPRTLKRLEDETDFYASPRLLATVRQLFNDRKRQT